MTGSSDFAVAALATRLRLGGFCLALLSSEAASGRGWPLTPLLVALDAAADGRCRLMDTGDELTAPPSNEMDTSETLALGRPPLSSSADA